MHRVSYDERQPRIRKTQTYYSHRLSLSFSLLLCVCGGQDANGAGEQASERVCDGAFGIVVVPELSRYDRLGYFYFLVSFSLCSDGT